MPAGPPPIDPRSQAEVEDQLRKLLAFYLKDPPYRWPAGADGGEPGRALTGICAYYAGQVIDRINRSPEKNFLAFLDLLGNSLIPPIPAELPLTFFLDSAAVIGQPVPAGTRVQSDTVDAAGEAVVFQTDSDLWLSNFDLKGLWKQIEGANPPPKDLSTSIVGASSEPLEPLRRQETAAPAERLFEQPETFYFGLQLDPGRALEANRPTTVYFFLDDLAYDSTSPAPPASGESPRIVWEYSAPAPTGNPQIPCVWLPLAVEDGTAELTHSGAVSFLVPESLVRCKWETTTVPEMYWVRASLRAPSGQRTVYASAPRLRGVALNTVAARHGVSIRDEILGSSSGTPGQTFRTFRRPILAGEQLEVLESRAGGAPGVAAAQDWTTWQGVEDFYRSSRTDRHYVVDRQAGTIRFGDGQRGMIPPPGTRNLRMASYRTGGGSAGNVTGGTAKTLMGGGRFIQKVVNLIPASGGAPGETQAALLDRAPRALRHRHRAVTDEDYEDLAKLASTDVARALCVSLIDLAREPVKVIASVADEVAGAGKVSVIVVPRSDSPNPLPSLALLRHVEQDLRQKASVTALISVVGPIYLSVGVKARIKLASLNQRSRVDRELQQELAEWLHPLRGKGGAGWAFGRLPHESDIYRLVSDKVTGISHVINLTLNVEAEVLAAGWANNLSLAERTKKVRQTRRFLVCSGQHEITFD